MQREPRWLTWAKELQSIAQIGLTYSKDPFDLERFTRIRAISVEMMHERTGIADSKLVDLFASETGYQTPKIDVRASVFQDCRILLVRERSDLRWTLPGGWADIGRSLSEVAEAEVWEEASVRAKIARILAVLDRGKQDHPVSAYSVYKIFVEADLSECPPFEENTETLERGFFGLDELPPLSIERVNVTQITMCFEAYENEQFHCRFD